MLKGKLFAIFPGIIMVIFGIVFHLQGKGIVGPESSFMYYNPQWIDYGIIIVISGIVIIGLGIIIQRKI